MARSNDFVNKFSSTPRRVFDKAMDKVEIKRQRDKEDHRADLKAIFHRIINLEQALQDLADHTAHHCDQLKQDPDGSPREDTRDS